MARSGLRSSPLHGVALACYTVLRNNDKKGSTLTTTETTVDPRVTALTTLLKGVGGEPALADLLAIIRPDEPSIEAPTSPPTVSVITDKEREAIDALGGLFGAIVPDTVRALAPIEALALMRERLALDAIEKLAKQRKENIRTAVFNHFDVTSGEADRDAKGHKLLPGELPVTSEGKTFTREVTQAERFLTVDGLGSLVDEGVLSKDDFLAMTRPVRVVDPAKVTLFLRRKPEAALTLERAVTVGNRVGKFWVRPLKKA